MMPGMPNTWPRKRGRDLGADCTKGRMRVRVGIHRFRAYVTGHMDGRSRQRKKPYEL